MSNKRNEARRKHSASPPDPVMEQPSGGSLLNFSIPTEVVDLPSKGRLYPVGHPLHGKETVEIRHMTAKEEDILSSQSLLRKGLAINKMLDSIILEEGVTSDDLLIGDKNALMYAARITGYGAAYDAQVICQNCNQDFEFQFDLSKYNECYTSIDEEDNVKFTENGTAEIELPKTKILVEIRALTGADELKLEKTREMKERNKLPDAGLTDMMKMMIFSANGVMDTDQINRLVDVLPASDSKLIRDTYKRVMPNVVFKQDAECHHCGHTMETEVPITGGFFWPG